MEVKHAPQRGQFRDQVCRRQPGSQCLPICDRILNFLSAQMSGLSEQTLVRLHLSGVRLTGNWDRYQAFHYDIVLETHEILKRAFGKNITDKKSAILVLTVPVWANIT